MHPLALASFTFAFHGVEDALRVFDLVDGGRPLGAVLTATSGMVRIAFELAHLERFVIDVGQKSASGLAVETDRGDDGVVALDFFRPPFWIVLDPIIPLLRGRIAL